MKTERFKMSELTLTPTPAVVQCWECKKEFLEDECQRALFALTTKVQPDINYFIV